MSPIKTVFARDIDLPVLYHISFNDKLEGVWDPEFNQRPDENHPEEPDPSKEAFYPEPNIGRISVAPTIQGCFTGVYPNVSKFFEKFRYPYMHFHVYVPEFKGSERIVTPETLTKDRLVWDAVITQEYLILDKVQMNHWGTLRVRNTNRKPTGYIHPFGDKSLPRESIGPQEIEFTLVEYKTTRQRKTTKVKNALQLFQ